MQRIALFVLAGFITSGPAFAQTNYSDNAATGLGFGGAVAVGGGSIFAGSAPVGWPRGAEPAGEVYRYEKQGDGWVEMQRLQAEDGANGDHFGRSLYADASMLIVGAPGNLAAYVFEPSADGAWRQTGKLVPGALGEDMEFAGQYQRGGNRTSAVTRMGDRIAVTSYSTSTSTGAVHVFHRMGNSWMEEVVLRPDVEHEEGAFGYSVASDGERLFVGATQENEFMGSVYVFTDGGTGRWSQESRIVLKSEQSGRALLGRALAVDDGRLFVSAPSFERTGSVFVFEHGDAGWIQSERVTPPAAEEGMRPRFGFGNSLAASGNTLAVSAGGVVLMYDLKALDAAPTVVKPQDDHSRPSFGTGLALEGDVAAIGSPGADYEEGIATAYERRMNAWQPVTKLISDVVSLESITGEEARCEDGDAGGFDCDNVDLVSFISLDEISHERGAKLTDIWGWEDPVTGKEWVLQGRTDGTSFIDISNPSYPLFVGELLRTEGSPGSSWRDVKVYRDHAFIVSDGADAHGVQIFDLTQLRDVEPQDMPVEFEETAHYDGVHSTHNIVINEDTGYAFAVGNRAGGETCNGQLHMIDIRDPVNPKFAGCYSHESSGGTHDAQCVTYRGDDTDYVGREICLSSNGSAFVIADVTDKENPVSLAITDYPNVNYTHQGWLTDDHNYFFMNDELDELNGAVTNTRTLIWDVRDLEDPALVKEFLIDSRASDHNLYIQGNFLYESNYQAGLRVLDISDPENPVEVGHFDTTPFGDDAAGFGGTWSNYPYFRSGIIATGSRGEGLFLLRKREPGL